jgi:hypothetical protein
MVNLYVGITDYDWFQLWATSTSPYKRAGVKEVDLPVRDLDDTTMARMMAQENMEEWDSSALVEQETIRAIRDSKDRKNRKPQPNDTGHTHN